MTGEPSADAARDDGELLDRLKNLLIFEEGRIVLRNGLHVAYRDSKGISTIGYGFNLEAGAAGVLARVTPKPASALIDRTAFLTESEAQRLLLISEEAALKGARAAIPRFGSLDMPRRVVLAAMVYQIGQGGFGRFVRLIEGVRTGDWSAVAQSMEASKWYRSDSPLRARRMVAAVVANAFPASAVLSPPGQRFTAVPLTGTSAASAGAVHTPPTRVRSPWPFDNL